VFWCAGHFYLRNYGWPSVLVFWEAQVDVYKQSQNPWALATLGNADAGTTLNQTSDQLVKEQSFALILTGTDVALSNLFVKGAHCTEKVNLDLSEGLDISDLYAIEQPSELREKEWCIRHQP